jgi:hypothetical protein
MRAPRWARRHSILAGLIFGCILMDVAFLIGVSNAMQWLSEVTSPFAFAVAGVIVIATARAIGALRALIHFNPITFLWRCLSVGRQDAQQREGAR